MRLTDEELADAERRATKWLSGASGSVVVTRDQAISEEVMAYDVLDLLAELRERRAADLNSYDIDVLSWLRRMLADESFEPSLWETSIVVLDKLLGGSR